MKIHEYNEMMRYLTRPGKVLGNNINRKSFSKGSKREENIEERIARVQYELGDKKERPKHLDNKNIYSFEDRPKKVAKIPVIPPKPDLPNGHSDWSTEEWLESIDPGGWVNDKKVETDSLFEKYLELLKAGELLPGTTFQMFEKHYLDFDTDVISKINKKVLDQKRKEGLASVIGVDPNKI